MLTQGIKSIAGGFYGIDETNILAENITNVNEYTATDDCYCTFKTSWTNSVARRINGVAIEPYLAQNARELDAWLLKGQTLTLAESNGTKAKLNELKVFGLKQ